MLLLTGATGSIGALLLRRLTAADVPVRCLVRDPRRLGPERVRVQIALGDLADPGSFRHAMRGIHTVVHLAASIRDQPGASIEELGAMATWRLVRAAERAGAERFCFFSALGASTHSPARFMRTKALAERAVTESSVRSTIFAPSIVYAPGDRWLRLLEGLSLLPLVPVPGRGHALYQPIWAEDVADCAIAALRSDDPDVRYELAGPETLSHQAIVAHVLRSLGRRRPLVNAPMPLVRRTLRAVETLTGPAAFATWDEAQLLDMSMTTPRGTIDAERLGVTPRTIRAVLNPAGAGAGQLDPRLPRPAIRPRLG